MNESKLLQIKALAYAIDNCLMNISDKRKEQLSYAIVLSEMLIKSLETESGEL